MEQKTHSPFTLAPDFAPVDDATWRARVEQDLKGAPFEKKLVHKTLEGFSIQPVYSNAPPNNHGASLPGQGSMLRGTSALSNALEGWQIRQSCNAPSPKEANAQILEDLQQGAASILLQVDASGDAPSRGISWQDESDVQDTLQNVLLELAPVGIDAGDDYFTAAALFHTHLQKEKIDTSKVRVDFYADPIGNAASRGSNASDLQKSLQRALELVQFCQTNLPGARALAVDTSSAHLAGASEGQDLAISMATALTYLRESEKAGINLQTAASHIVFRLHLGTDFFLGIARLRALRRLWSRITNACGIQRAAAIAHVLPSRRVLTRRDPWVNMLRNTAVCFAGAVGGAEAITTLSFDAPVTTPDALSRRIARNTQSILLHESHLNRVLDPAGGSWFLENLTESLSQEAWNAFQDIETAGGIIKALESGHIASMIEEVAQKRHQNIARRKSPITGVSAFPNLGETLPENAPATLPKHKNPGDAPTQAPQSLEELIQCFLQGTRVRALHKAPPGALTLQPLPHLPDAASFEALRDRSDRLPQRPTVFLANLGTVAEHTARATFAQNFVEAGGFKALSNKGFLSAQDAAEAFAQSGAKIAVLCSSNARYEEFAEDLAKTLKASGAIVAMAGRPGKHEEAWKAAGIEHYMYLGCDVLDVLHTLWNLTEEEA